ncbi:MAG: hypothetical protein ABW033_03480 [Acidimicrobiia bacterium]
MTARVIRLVIGVLLVLVGVVWVGQGVGIIEGSFMTGEAVWAVIGAVCLALGAMLLVTTLRASTREP